MKFARQHNHNANIYVAIYPNWVGVKCVQNRKSARKQREPQTASCHFNHNIYFSQSVRFPVWILILISFLLVCIFYIRSHHMYVSSSDHFIGLGIFSFNYKMPLAKMLVSQVNIFMRSQNHSVTSSVV